MYESKAKEQQQNMKSHKHINKTGIPTPLKEKFEALSGLSLDDVTIHYNSSAPVQMYARAYTCGSHVHIAPGQEKYLGHELGHVIQQKQGIVHPDSYINGLPVNTDRRLESQADSLSRSASGLPFLNEPFPKDIAAFGHLIQREPINMTAFIEMCTADHPLAAIAAILGISMAAAITLYRQCFHRSPEAASPSKETIPAARTLASEGAQRTDETMSTTPAPVRRLVGDCLYNAVADALGESTAAIDYRQRTANYIQAFYQEHPDEFADNGINAHELWETVLTSQEWDNDSGDGIPEFLALALDIHMIIHAGNSLYDLNPNGQRIIHLLLEDNHYTVHPHSAELSGEVPVPAAETVSTPEPVIASPSEKQHVSADAQLRSALLQELHQFIDNLPDEVRQSAQNALKKRLRNKASSQELAEYLRSLQQKFIRQKSGARPPAPAPGAQVQGAPSQTPITASGQIPVAPRRTPITASRQIPVDSRRTPIAADSDHASGAVDPDPIASILGPPVENNPSSYSTSLCHQHSIIRTFLLKENLISPNTKKVLIGHQGGKASKSGHKRKKKNPDSQNFGKQFVVIINDMCYEIFRANHSGDDNQQYTIIKGTSNIPGLTNQTIRFDGNYIKFMSENIYL